MCYAVGMAENKPIRFRAAPEVHAAKDVLDARGVDVGELLSRHLVEQAKPHPTIYDYALKAGMEAHVFEAWDFDGHSVKVVTDGAGKPWPLAGMSFGWTEYDAHPRHVLLFQVDGRDRIRACSGVVIVNGDEMVPPFGVFLTPEMATWPPGRWIEEAERRAKAAR